MMTGISEGQQSDSHVGAEVSAVILYINFRSELTFENFYLAKLLNTETQRFREAEAAMQAQVAVGQAERDVLQGQAADALAHSQVLQTHVCTCIYICVCMYICRYVYLYMHMLISHGLSILWHTPKCCRRIYVYIHIHMCVCIYACVYLYICIS